MSDDVGRSINDLTPDEIFTRPVPANPKTLAAIETLLALLQGAFPGAVAMILIGELPAVEGEEPRFTYGATSSRADMIAVLRAFVDRQETLAPVLDKIGDDPPPASRQ